MKSEQGKRLLKKLQEDKEFDEDIKLTSDAKVSFCGGRFSIKVDTIFLKKEIYNDYAVLLGYAHDEKGGYDYDYLTADDITNIDLDDYMYDTRIINIEKFIEFLDENGLLW